MNRSCDKVTGSYCCLCSTNLEDKKKVKLNGKAASVCDTRKIIADLLKDVFDIAYDSSGLSTSGALICYGCVNELSNMKSFEDKLNKMRAKVIGLLREAIPVSDLPRDGTSQGSSNKRRRDANEHGICSPTKYVALQDAVGGPNTPVRSDKRQPSRVGVSLLYYV